MWMKVWFFGYLLSAWSPPRDLWSALGLAEPSDPRYTWAQVSDDGPYRLLRKG